MFAIDFDLLHRTETNDKNILERLVSSADKGTNATVKPLFTIKYSGTQVIDHADSEYDYGLCL